MNGDHSFPRFPQTFIVWTKGSLNILLLCSVQELLCTATTTQGWVNNDCFFYIWVTTSLRTLTDRSMWVSVGEIRDGWWQEGEESRRETDRGKQSHHLPVLALLSPLLHCTNYCLPCSPISMQQGSLSAPLAPGHWIRYLRCGVRGSRAVRPVTPWIIWDSCSPLTRREEVEKRENK